MELSEGEALFRAVFEQAAVGVALIETATGRYMRVNQCHCDLLGYTPEETTALDFQTITHPDDLSEDLAHMARLATGEIRSFTMEKRYFRKDGSIVWVILTVSSLWEPGSPPSFHVAVVQDITERKRTEAALRDSEQIFHQLMERSPIYVFFKDDQIRPIRLSKNYEAMLGRPIGELLGKTMDDLFPSDLAKSMVEDDKRLLTEGKVVEVDEQLHGRHFHTVKFPIHLDGKPLYLGGFTIETTERVLAEAALRESEEKYRTLYNEAPVMLHSIDATGRLLSVSDRWLEALGYERAEVIGRKSTDFLTDASRKYAEETILPQFFKTGTMEDVHYQFVRRNGEVLDILLSAVAERNAAGEFVCSRAALIDVTERKRIEETLRQAQKMESVGRLAGGIAHDFNNLLSVILGNVELALESLRAGDPLRKDLREVQKAGERAAALTQQLLAFSRKQVLQPRTVNLNQIVSGIESMLRRLIGEDIEFANVLAPDLWLTRADPGQLEQVILNVVLNARESMPGGGKLTVETSNAVLDDGYVARNVGMKPGEFVVLSVTDTGVGMDEATKAHLFEPFFTTREQGKGTGLGLATVYGIVKQSGGDINVYSELGTGTRFKIYLPREQGHLPADALSPSPATIVRGHETVMVVEDEGPVRVLATRILQLAGYSVLSAASGGEALRTCESHPGPIHLLLTDVVMPQMSGRTLAAQLLQVRPEVKVLYMSGYTDNAIVHHGVLDAGTEFISKPFSAADLSHRVRQVLDAQTPPASPPPARSR